METDWNLVSGGRGQNSNFTNSIACDIWQLGSTTSTSRYDYWINPHNSFPHLPTAPASTTTSTPSLGEASGFHAFVHHQASPSTGFYAGAGTHFNPPDPHLMCLKLGKRHYFEDATPLGDRHVASVSKRGKMRYYGYGASSGVTVVAPSPPPVPRCQVEGCQAAMLNAKEYHRRHKVCEMHSKAPKVLVHGIEQRFCQQCSRFHEVSQFDESKRSCRRRLAGHNERRRKSSHDHSLARNPPQENILTTDRFSHLSSPTGCALSLLSSKNEPWIFSSDLSSRCSAALRELIAENRASILGKQFILDKGYHRRNNHTIESFSENQNINSSHPDHVVTNHHQILHDSQIWDRFNESRHECDTPPGSNFCI